MDKKSYMVSLKDIEQPYITKTREKLYLRNINLNIIPGEIFGIIGRSGSGKTALLKCISLIERPATGIVCIDKMNYTVMVKNELREARRNVGIASQQVQLLSNRTVYDNVILPLEFHDYDEDDISIFASQILEITGLSDKSGLYPRQLSQVQLQCLSIARAMVTKPKLLLCDEITSGLDSKNTQFLLKILKEINHELKTTIVMVTNDIEIIKSMCDRVGVMHQGEMLEQANTFDFFTAPKSEIGKDFIRATTKLEMPLIYRRKLKLQHFENSHPIIRATFASELSPETLFEQTIEKYQVKISIIQAHQEIVKNKFVKILIAEVKGDIENTISTVKYLEENGLNTEILGYLC